MAKTKGSTTPAVIVAVVGHAKITQQLETVIKNFAAIRSMHYLTEPDTHNWPQIRVAIYMVDAYDLRVLKSSLRNLENHKKCDILIR